MHLLKTIVIIFSKINVIISSDLYMNLCATKECFTTGFLINESLKTRANPCDDFYDFSCGDYKVKNQRPGHELYWNRWTSTESVLKERVKRLIERDVELKTIKTFYESCLENKDYSRDFIGLIDVFGSWPLASNKGKWMENSFDWLFLNSEMVRLLKIYPLFKMNVQIDHKNTKKYAIYITSPNLIIPKFILLNPIEYVSEVFAYKQWIIKTVGYLYGIKKWSNLSKDINEMVEFESDLAKIIQNGSNKHKQINLGKFNELTKQNWTRNLNLIFTDVTKITDDFQIYYTDYIFDLVELTETTKKSIIANYLIWYLTTEFSRDSSETSKKLNFEINKIILGIETDVPRETECISKTIEYMSPYLMRKYSKNYLKSSDLIKVNRLVENLRISFLKILKKNVWMSSATKRLAIEKIQSIKFEIGYPNWIQNDKTDYLNDINITRNYFANVLELRRILSMKNFKKINSQTIQSEWPENFFNVNAYYSPLQNSILVSIGLLETPFFHKNRPSVFNYASLGTLIGHELAHALDPIGRNSDKNGNTKKWWSLRDIKIFNKHFECFEDYYKQKYGEHILGTLNENLADLVGFRISYDAYVSSRKISGVIPFLENFNEEQIFFISYAQLWCEISKKQDVLQDEHSPVEIRVEETVRSADNFERVFQCDREKKLKKCSFW